MALFKSLIFCARCGRRYKSKRRTKGSKIIYLCGLYDNFSSKCERGQIDEERLLWFVEGHYFPLNSKEINREFILENVEKIIVQDDVNFEIFYKDGTKSISTPTKMSR